MSGKEYRTITDVKGPLVFLNKTEPQAFGEIVQQNERWLNEEWTGIGYL